MDSATIRFEEIQTNLSELVQQISTPGGERNGKLPFSLSVELRKMQMKRLEENIGVLRKKQQEFKRRMESYIGGLQKLIASVDQGLARDQREHQEEEEQENSKDSTGTLVRCVGCGSETEFPDVNVLVALEPGEYLSSPTQVIIEEGGKLKKGVFKCPGCGECQMTIKPSQH